MYLKKISLLKRLKFNLISDNTVCLLALHKKVVFSIKYIKPIYFQ